MRLFTLIGRVVAWLAGARAWAPYFSARVYRVPPTSWLHRWFFVRFDVAAFTWGETVIAQAKYATNAQTLRHEYAHALQARRWSLAFPVAYVAASVWAVLKGGHAYEDNAFEVEARAAEKVAP